MKGAIQGLILAILACSATCMSLPSVTDKPVNIADALERLKSATELVVNKGSDKVDVEAKPTMSLKKPITKIEPIPGLDENPKIDKKPKLGLRDWEGNR
jgi:hypothetical protein